ncbi:MAG: hypothetical protein ACUVX9_16040, partial [Anaerolineae bacterium]
MNKTSLYLKLLIVIVLALAIALPPLAAAQPEEGTGADVVLLADQGSEDDPAAGSPEETVVEDPAPSDEPTEEMVEQDPGPAEEPTE